MVTDLQLFIRTLITLAALSVPPLVRTREEAAFLMRRHFFG
jgi:hypothetical protein